MDSDPSSVQPTSMKEPSQTDTPVNQPHSSTQSTAAAAACTELSDEEKKREPSSADVQWHGHLAQSAWKSPQIAASSKQQNRPGYNSRSAQEYLDDADTLAAKVKQLAELIRAARHVCVYTGAGISTAAGIGDYASKAKGSVAPHKQRGARKGVNRLKLLPTFAHKALAAMQQKKMVEHWVQQNHDRLAQKAGYPQARLNEIHGAWKDAKNRVLMMDEQLRPDLVRWLEQWSERADLCIAMGTSICGMTADTVAEECARRYLAGQSGQLGLVIVNLQKTPADNTASLRIWGLLDDVLRLLAKELKVKVPNSRAEARGKRWVQEHVDCTYSTPKRTAKDSI